MRSGAGDDTPVADPTRPRTFLSQLFGISEWFPPPRYPRLFFSHLLPSAPEPTRLPRQTTHMVFLW